jgi:hypothetical protein
VLSVTHNALQVDFLVGSVPDAVAELTAAGATLEAGPLDIPVGRVAVLRPGRGRAARAGS